MTYCYDGNTSGSCNGAPSGSGNYFVGRLTMVKNDTSTTKFLKYDALGQVLRHSQTTTGETYLFGDALDVNVKGYEYDRAGGLTAVRYPSGRKVSYTNNALGQPEGATGTKGENTTDYVSGAAYHPHGVIKHMVMGNAHWQQACYNARLQPEFIRLGASTTQDCAYSNDFVNFELGYGSANNNGNVLSSTVKMPDAANPGQTLSLGQTFSYDDVNRLTSAVESGGWSEGYGYDQYGNRWVSSRNGLPDLPSDVPTASSAYSLGNNRVAATSYDSAGNRLNWKFWTSAYDADNHVTQAAPDFNGSAK